MSARRRPSAAPKLPARPAAVRPGRRIATRVAIAALLAAAVVAVVLARRPAHRNAGGPADSAFGEAAFATAIRLMGDHRSFESLPYFRRALASSPGSPYVAHLNFAGALYNSLFEGDTLAGRVRPRWRTSVERAQVMDECLAHMLAAADAAPTDRDRAQVCDRIGRMLNTWGFRWEALMWFSRAVSLDPGVGAYADHHDALLAQLQDPSRRIASIDEGPLAP